jgi:ABC-type phosphate transport system substrate-binding protein
MFRSLPFGSARTLAALGLGLATVSWSAASQAAECKDLSLKNPVYGAGGSAVTATLKKVAQALAALDEPITILYSDPGACDGYSQFVANKIVKTFKYWDKDGKEFTCDPPLAGQPADFAHMGNTADFCIGGVLPADVGDFQAPVQTINVIADKDSSEKAISAEALYLIFGLGSKGEAAPWTKEASVFTRNQSSFVHLFLAESIKVPPSSFIGTVKGTNGETVKAVADAGATDPDSTLGYVSGSAADAGRASVKTLAYQHYGQTCGYLPDSSETTLDKANVRSGRYWLWTPGHFFTRIDTKTKKIKNATVEKLIGWFNGTLTPPGSIDVTKIIIEAGDIPQCAMRATRSGTLGAIASYAPENPCGCYFEKIATGATTCDACSDDSKCSGTSKCRYGYCEAY